LYKEAASWGRQNTHTSIGPGHPTGIVKKAAKAKVAVYTCGLDIAQTETKGTVLLKKAEELLDFTRGEEKQLESVGTVRDVARDGTRLLRSVC
jgi:T-complex protein 1 subunit theta